jgi:hypothetical protein
MNRIFDQTKEYICSEVFRLEEVQDAVAELEELIDEDDELGFVTEIGRVISSINDFLKKIEEQEKRK